MKSTQISIFGKAILVGAVATVLATGCGSSSSSKDDPIPDPIPSEPPTLDDDGLVNEPVDIGTLAAFEGATINLLNDASELANFLDTLDTALFGAEPAGLAPAMASQGLFNFSVVAEANEQRRAARMARAEGGALRPAGVDENSEEGEFEVACAGGGTFTDAFTFTESIGETSFGEQGSTTWTFDNCAGTVGDDVFVVNGTWTESFDYLDTWTEDENGGLTGTFGEDVSVQVALTGDRGDTEGAFMLDGTLNRNDDGSYAFDGVAGYSEEVTVTQQAPRMEGRLINADQSRLYIAQIGGQIVNAFSESFDFNVSEEMPTEFSGSTEVTGQIVSTALGGALTITTPTAIRFTSEAECPHQGVLNIAGGEGGTIEVFLGEDTGVSGVAAQIVAGDASENYAQCSEVSFLQPFLDGPFLFLYANEQ